MRSIILIGLVLLFSASLSAWEISGTVRDIDNRPLADIMIQLLPEDIRAVSNNSGGFSFSLPDSYQAGDRVTIKTEAANYFPDIRTITLKKKITTLHILLVPKKLLKEEITVTALNEKEKAISIPFAQSVTSQMEIRESQPESVVIFFLRVIVRMSGK